MQVLSRRLSVLSSPGTLWQALESAGAGLEPWLCHVPAKWLNFSEPQFSHVGYSSVCIIGMTLEFTKTIM